MLFCNECDFYEIFHDRNAITLYPQCKKTKREDKRLCFTIARGREGYYTDIPKWCPLEAEKLVNAVHGIAC